MYKMFLKALTGVVFMFAHSVCAQTFSKNNGVISYNANVNGVPMISNLYILGTRVMPYDNVGAGFQMTGRSAAGNAYNPTQAGDCTQQPSQVIAIMNNWTGADVGISASNSLLFSVAPRNYNEPSTCLGPGATLPYQFEFGATLGDGIVLPKEAMLLDMYYTRWPGSEVLQKGQSETPSIFPFLNIFPLAYWSSDGINMQPFTVQVSGGATNDMRRWPAGVNYSKIGKLVMACSSTQSICLALYSNKPTIAIMSRRNGASNSLALLTLTMDSSGVIDDYDTHHARKLLAIGTPSTISTVVSQTVAAIDDWGDL